MGGRKVAVLIMLVVAVAAMVGGGDAASSSLTLPFCYLECVRGCGVVDDACFASCHSKCPYVVTVGGAAGDASSSLPTSPAASSSSLTTPNNLATVTCYLDCVRGCRSDPNRNVCIAGCATKCPAAVTVGAATGDASSSLPTSPAASWSSLTTRNNLHDPSCILNCAYGCGTDPNPMSCAALCVIGCPLVVTVGGAAGDASSSLPTSPDHDRFCNLGCVSSMCTSLISNYDGVNGHEAVKGCLGSCADICSPSSTKLGLGQGRDQLV